MERIRSTASRFKDKIANDYLTVMRSTEEGAKLVNNDDISSRLEAWIDNLFVVRNDEEGINQHIENHFAAGEKYVRINMRSHLLNLSARSF